MAKQNPAYVEWVTMIKGDQEKPVHPANVKNHENVGWVRKAPPAPEESEESAAYQELTLPELTDAIVSDAEAKKASLKAEVEAKKAERKAKREAAQAAKKAAKAETDSTNES